MKKIIVIFLVLGFSIPTFSNSEAGKFDKYDKELEKITMDCYSPRDVKTTYATDGKDIYHGGDIVRSGNKILVIFKVTSVDKKKGENTFVYTIESNFSTGVSSIRPVEIYVNFEKRVVIQNDVKQRCL
jgi:hypothetical protein